MRVKAAVLRQYDTPLAIEAVDLDEPREGEILVRLVASGVGRHDLDAIAGQSGVPLPFVPGSEGAGYVERVGPGVSQPQPGDAVVIGYSACRTCPRCISGDTRSCERFVTLNLSGRRADGTSPLNEDGAEIFGFFFGQSAFATHVVCRAMDAIIVDMETPLEAVVALGGEFLTGAAPILQLPASHADETIIVIGAGFVGLAACLVAKALGFEKIIVAEHDESRSKLALEVGATITVTTDSLATVVKSLSPDGARFALETTGTAVGREACGASLAPGAVCALTYTSGGPEDADSFSHLGATTSADSGIDVSTLLPRLLALYKDGALPIEKLINFFQFEHVNDALDAIAAGDVVKPVLRFSLGSFGSLDRAKREGAAMDEPGNEPKSEPSDDGADQDVAAPAEVTA